MRLKAKNKEKNIYPPDITACLVNIRVTMDTGLSVTVCFTLYL